MVGVPQVSNPSSPSKPGYKCHPNITVCYTLEQDFFLHRITWTTDVPISLCNTNASRWTTASSCYHILPCLYQADSWIHKPPHARTHAGAAHILISRWAGQVQFTEQPPSCILTLRISKWSLCKKHDQIQVLKRKYTLNRYKLKNSHLLSHPN